MKCNQCNAKWTAPNSQTTHCPFCGTPLLQAIESSALEEQDILKHIVSQYGKEIFDRSADVRLEGLLSDFMAHDRKMQRLFRMAIRDGIAHELMKCDASDSTEKTIRLNSLKIRFQEDNFLEKDMAFHAVDCFAFALGWKTVQAKTDDEILTEHWQLVEEKKYSEAYGLIVPLAEKGNAEAQFALGSMYYYSYGVSWDYTKAMEWYRKAAEQGNADAQYQLGDMYYWSYGVSQDFAKAAEWYRRAARKREMQLRNII
jgi:hypothetical protein